MASLPGVQYFTVSLQYRDNILITVPQFGIRRMPVADVLANGAVVLRACCFIDYKQVAVQGECAKDIEQLNLV